MSTVKTVTIKYEIKQSLGDSAEWQIFRTYWQHFPSHSKPSSPELVSTCESREEAEELVRELEGEKS